MFNEEEPTWIRTKPLVENQWSPCLQTLEGHGRSVWSVAFSQDSRYIASGSDDHTVKVWDMATGACMQTLEGHDSLVRSIAFDSSGSYLLTDTGCIKLCGTADPSHSSGSSSVSED
jgi:WD40 repeat protein